MKLNRANLATKTGVVAATPTERIVHIGLGAFHRAHQAWFTAQVDTEKQWGIVAFTGRSANAAEELASQDGLFTLITRSEAGDEFQVIDSIVRAEDGKDTEAFTTAISNPKIAIVTLTITEAGYGMDASGHVDTVNPPAALHRLAVALETRRRLNGAPIAIVSCDNMPSNGALLKVAMGDLFGSFGAESVAWMNANVSFVSTSIDRITPKTTEADVATVLAETGWDDCSPVVTESFRDWVLEGEFPLGRPAWENAGARFVDHIEPFENRKLWLLNGSHSLLAYAGQLRGHETVAESIADDTCLEWVEEFWNEAVQHLPADGLDLPNYRAALLGRFRNAKIAHRLAQIAIDGSTKLRVRVAPVAKAELAEGRQAQGCARVISAWVDFVIAKTGRVEDSQAQSILQAYSATRDLEADREQLASRLVAIVDSELAINADFMDLVLNRTRV
ncbi:MAG: mannitol dehydrogenase family protein [Rhodoluna sp.]